jgi:type II secretory pathway component HofQ
VAPVFLPNSRIIVCSAETPSIGLGLEWSITTATLAGSNTASTPMFSSARIASGVVPS